MFGLASAALPRRSHGLLMFHGRGPFSWLFLTRRGFAAVTFGRVVITAEPELPPQTMVHELHHVYQYEQLGLLFMPVYSYWHLRRGYWDNPLELSAVHCADKWLAEQPEHNA